MKRLLPLLLSCCVLPVSLMGQEAPPVAKSDRAAVVEDNNAFAVELYGQLRKQGGNLFFSPESISTALAMAQPVAEPLVSPLPFPICATLLNPVWNALVIGRTIVCAT